MRLRKLLGIMIAVLAIAGCCVFVYYQIDPDSAGQIKIVKNTEMKENTLQRFRHRLIRYRILMSQINHWI